MSGFVEAGIAYAVMLGLLFFFSSKLLNEIDSLEAELADIGSASEEE